MSTAEWGPKGVCNILRASNQAGMILCYESTSMLKGKRQRGGKGRRQEKGGEERQEEV